MSMSSSAVSPALARAQSHGRPGLGACLLLLLCLAGATSMPMPMSMSMSMHMSAGRAAPNQAFLVLVTASAPSMQSPGQNVLWRVTVDGAARRLLSRRGAASLADPVVSPDQRQVAYVADGRELWQMDADGSRPHLLYTLPASGGSRLSDPRYAPGGAGLTVTAGCCGHFTVYSLARDGSRRTALFGGAGPRIFQDWLPSGSRTLLTEDGALWTADARGGRQAPLAGDVPGAGNFLDAHYSPDGTHIVAALIPAQGQEAAATLIVLLHADGQYLTSLTRDLAYDVGTPSWSADGKSIAFRAGSGAFGALGRQHDLWLMRYDGSQKRNITRGRLGDVVAVAWAR
jgi:Tol biopolymer transport system component